MNQYAMGLFNTRHREWANLSGFYLEFDLVEVMRAYFLYSLMKKEI